MWDEVEDAKLHKELWDKGDFRACADVMRRFRAAYGDKARQEGDGSVSLTTQVDGGLDVVFLPSGRIQKLRLHGQGATARLVEVKE